MGNNENTTDEDGKVTVHVVDENGEPIEGAQVRISKKGEEETE